MFGDLAGLHLAVAILLSAPLLYAAVSKLLDPSRFVAAIPRFGLGFLSPSAHSARLVGLLELAGGAAPVILPVPTACIVAGLVYGVFSVLLLRARLLGASGDCGCFGAIAGGIDGGAVVRNGILALGSFVVAYARNNDLLASYDLSSAALTLVAVTLASATTDTLLEVRRGAT